MIIVQLNIEIFLLIENKFVNNYWINRFANKRILMKNNCFKKGKKLLLIVN